LSYRRWRRRVCDTCIITKHRRVLFPAKANYRATAAPDLIHGDLCGPITPTTPGGQRYLLHLVDDAIRYMWLKLLMAKSDATTAIKEIKVATELEVRRPLRVLQTDNGGEFKAKEFVAYCANEGIQRHFSAPYTQQQNGVVERWNQTVLGTTRALLKQRAMPTLFWGEAVTTAIFLLNRAPTKAYNGRKSAVGFLRTFGCLSFVKDKRSGLKKLYDRSALMVFNGYSKGAKAYRLFDPAIKWVHTSRDIIFDESRRWDWSTNTSNGESATQQEFTVKYYTVTTSWVCHQRVRPNCQQLMTSRNQGPRRVAASTQYTATAGGCGDRVRNADGGHRSPQHLPWRHTGSLPPS
jgi:transposase InsO family protein